MREWSHESETLRMELPGDIERDLGTIDVSVPAFRVEPNIWTQVVEAGLADEVRRTYAVRARANHQGLYAVCELLETAGIFVADIVEEDSSPPLLSERWPDESAAESTLPPEA